MRRVCAVVWRVVRAGITGVSPAGGPVPAQGQLCCTSSPRAGKERLARPRLLWESWMMWFQSWASTDDSVARVGSQEPWYVCFTILLLLKDCDTQCYIWHGWHVQYKTWLDLVYISIKCQETDCEMFALKQRWGACMRVFLLCVAVFSFSLVLHKNVNNFMFKVLFLISVLSKV